MPADKRSAVTNELLYETIKRMHADIGALREDMLEVKQRLGFLEAQYANLSSRVDRIDERTLRIEKRLDLVEV